MSSYFGSVRLIAVLLLLRVSTAAIATDDLPGAVVIYGDGAEVRVEAIESDRFSTPDGQEALVVWAQGDVDRWQTFKGTWVKPSEGVDSDDVHRFELASLSRGQHHAPVSPQLAQQTTLLTQLRVNPLTRGTGSILVPYQGAVLLNPQLTFRREAAADGEKLGAAEASVFRGKTKVLTVPFAAGQTAVSWTTISNLPEPLKTGLPTGSYRLEIQSQVGTERVRFSVAPSELRKEVERHSDKLAGLLDSQTHPLVLQVAAEQMLLTENPHLADALDVLDRVEEKELTPHLQSLQDHIEKRLLDPDADHEFYSTTRAPTGVDVIDTTRSFIAAGLWARAMRTIEEIDFSSTGVPQGLGHLYRGVILSEAGNGRRDEVEFAFDSAISQLRTSPQSNDALLVAHRNISAHWTSAVFDQLHDFSFRRAAGVRHPLMTLLVDWTQAELHLKSAQKLQEEAGAVEPNAPLLNALLGDALLSLTPPDTDNRFLNNLANIAFKKASTDAAARLAVLSDQEPEALQHLATLTWVSMRTRRESESRRSALVSIARSIDIGSMTAIENAYRTQGIVNVTADRELALHSFKISSEIGKILQGRFAAERTGKGLAGFFARRAPVIENTIELLLERGLIDEAFESVEELKANALRQTTDQLNLGAIGPTNVEFSPWSGKDLVVEYFLTPRSAWVFMLAPGRKLEAFRLRSSDGNVVEPRILVRRCRDIAEEIDSYKDTNPQFSQVFDNTWQDRLLEIYQVMFPRQIRESMKSVKRLVIIPHHVLHYLPFSALVTKIDTEADRLAPATPEFLIDAPLDISYAPSATVLRHLSADPHGIDTVSVLADTRSSSGLLETKREVEVAKRAFSSRLRVYEEEQMTRRNACDALASSDFVFFGCHGDNDWGRPLESYLRIGDDILTASEIYDLRIKSSLVFLSACNTARGDRSPSSGDDIFGLERAFLASGVKTVVSGLWKVDDYRGASITTETMARFAVGSDINSALNHAQRTVLNKYRNDKRVRKRVYAHPHFWAVFKLTGCSRLKLAR